MENCIIDDKIYKDLTDEVNNDVIEKANKMVENKKIDISR